MGFPVIVAAQIGSVCWSTFDVRSSVRRPTLASLPMSSGNFPAAASFNTVSEMSMTGLFDANFEIVWCSLQNTSIFHINNTIKYLLMAKSTNSLYVALLYFLHHHCHPLMKSEESSRVRRTRNEQNLFKILNYKTLLLHMLKWKLCWISCYDDYTIEQQISDYIWQQISDYIQALFYNLTLLSLFSL